MDDKEFAKIDAQMQGLAVSLRHSGPAVEIGRTELFVLANLAEVGMLYLFARSDECSDHPMGPQLEDKIDALDLSITVRKLMSSGAALLGSERFGRYLISTGVYDDEHRP